ncbi:hypothetical protein AB4Z48_21675 [Cupriavidus sp. 2TAF22]|uniref:hypothetical protein n=1 Tax=unclassified Cupriavidus TaxID=2640874 RepID=UPI003F906255
MNGKRHRLARAFATRSAITLASGIPPSSPRREGLVRLRARQATPARFFAKRNKEALG